MMYLAPTLSIILGDYGRELNMREFAEATKIKKYEDFNPVLLTHDIGFSQYRATYLLLFRSCY